MLGGGRDRGGSTGGSTTFDFPPPPTCPSPPGSFCTSTVQPLNALLGTSLGCSLCGPAL